jgi:hypothetical protein
MPAPGRQRQEDGKSKDSLGYMEIPRLRKEEIKNTPTPQTRNSTSD